MIIRKKFVTVSVLTVLVIAGIAAVSKPNGKHKNLKILPNDISEQKLDSIMEAYSKALGSQLQFLPYCRSRIYG